MFNAILNTHSAAPGGSSNGHGSVDAKQMEKENEDISGGRTQTGDTSRRTAGDGGRPQSQREELETVASVSFSCSFQRESLDSNTAIRGLKTESEFAHEHEYIGILSFSANDRCYSS